MRLCVFRSFFCSSRRRHTRCALVTGVQTCALPILSGEAAWDLVDMDRYRRMWQERHGYFSLNMVASRGCPFRCNWCAKPIWGNHYGQRSAREVAAEMGLLKRAFRPDHIWIDRKSVV